MAAEGIHLCVIDDLTAGGHPELRRLLRVRAREARVGAVLPDLPYFAGFAGELVRYVAHRPPADSPWGDRFHRVCPSHVGLELMRAARRSARPEANLALALGYLSHVAVDWSTHPVVNAIARPAAVANHTTEAQEHRNVEKVQSVLFHQKRFGEDFMGSPIMRPHITVDGGIFDEGGGPVVAAALTAALGVAPARDDWRGWLRGYAQYIRVLTSPLGKLPVPAAAKRAGRAPYYDAVGFDRLYEVTLAAARRSLEFGLAAFDDDTLDDEAAWLAAVPEGSIDDPPVTPARPAAYPMPAAS